MRKKFAQIVHSQSSFSENPRVKSIEEKLGNFPFDDRLINDGVIKLIVGPRKFENGALYYGHWNAKTNERHGFGMQIWPDGSKYIGYWKNDRVNGQGRLIHNEGDVYSGTWKDDLAHGIGEYIDISGMTYRGDWVNDKQEGKGN